MSVDPAKVEEVLAAKEKALQVFGPCEENDHALLVGLAFREDDPFLLVFSQNVAKTERVLDGRFGAEVRYFGGFTLGSNAAGRAATLPNLGPGSEIGLAPHRRAGMLGCVLVDRTGGKELYGLTVRHAFPTKDANVFISARVGKVHTVSTSTTDWSLLEFDPATVRPTAQLPGEAFALTGDPVPVSELLCFSKADIGICGLQGAQRGNFIGLFDVRHQLGEGSCADTANQVVVEDLGSGADVFAENGDSGSVGYLAGPIGNHPQGTPVGLFWGIGTSLHGLAPLETVLKEIQDQAKLDLKLFP